MEPRGVAPLTLVCQTSVILFHQGPVRTCNPYGEGPGP
jgi:hypothetical protein